MACTTKLQRTASHCKILCSTATYCNTLDDQDSCRAVNNSVASSGVRGWHLIRSRAAIISCLTASLVALMLPFPVPQYPRYLHASSRYVARSVSPLIVNSSAGSCSLLFLSLSITNKYVFYTLMSQVWLWGERDVDHGTVECGVV